MKKRSREKENPAFSPLRASAEKLLRDIDLNDQFVNAKDFKAVFQELQVHQIELEMQNDELRLINVELERQRGRFSAIYDEAPVGYIILDHAGVIKDVNSTGLNLLKSSHKSKVMGNRLHNFISSEDSEEYYRFFVQMLKSKTTQQCELKILGKDHFPRYTRLQGSVQFTIDGRTECFIAMVDITERKRVKHELAATKERLELSLKASLAGTWELDIDTMTFFIDESSHSICSMKAGSFTGKLSDFISLIHPQYRKEVEDKFRISINSNKEVDVICRFGNSDDKNCYIVIRGHTVPDEKAGKRLVGIIMDITEKTQMEKYSQRLMSEQQKKIAAATLLTEENERRRISGVLHDSVSQLLYGIKMKLRQLGKDKNASEEIDAINSLLDEAITETRNISFELAPSILADFGLVATVEELVRRLSTKDLQISFKRGAVSGRMDLLLETNIYRIIQELINNVMKHSGASLLNIEVRKNKLIEIIVKDNGNGFNVTDQEASTSGSGLSSIKNRVSLYNGKIDINSIPGTGTTVHIKLSDQISE
ncbi:ATP-binding protein [Daejeonella sp.]|uniref:PAS domain-containing sensor histidine kinase n=1 Tax=Daejeonella sp. TaxID=2805397 RepID=UPI0030BA9307